jgi:taurine dioxygenase
MIPRLPVVLTSELDPLLCNAQRLRKEEPWMRNRHIEIAPIAGALGAEIGGVDVARDLDDVVIGEIRQALLDYGVIFFRDQDLDRERHKAFTRRFGEIFIHPN